jgi:ubiquinone/menaquinone biosynthesis C-methylase UbiE
LLETIPETATINDYGCGTGRAEVEINKARPKQSVNMLDISPAAIEEAALSLISKGEGISFQVADLSNLGDLKEADWGICINVLMTVQRDKIDKILAEIRRTCKNLVVEVYDFDDIRLGQNMTTVKLDKTGWMDKLSAHWSSVEFFQSPESAHRYIYVCRMINNTAVEQSCELRSLRNKYTGNTCYIVGRGASLLNVKKSDFKDGVVIVLNEAIQNIFELKLKNDIYSQWRNGDVQPDVEKYLRKGDGLILCDNPVGKDPAASALFKGYSLRYTFECQRDLGKHPPDMFSHAAAFEIAYQIFGCRNFVFVGFDSYKGDTRTILRTEFVKSEQRDGAYNEQIEVIKKMISEKVGVKVEWFFP